MSAYRRQVALGETASAIRRAGRFADSVKFGYLRPGRRVHAAPNRSAQQDYYPWPYHVQVLANPVAIHSPRALFWAEAIRGWSARRGLSPGGKCTGHRRPPWPESGVDMRALCIGAALAVWGWNSAAAAGPLPFLHRGELEGVSRHIQGQIVDYTHNHGSDRRIWSAALCQKRDLYVYLPPGFDPQQQYPFILWLHGFTQDEQSFLDFIAEPVDRAIVCGQLPPVIIAVPDGSLSGESSFMSAGSFFMNSNAGRFEDFVMQDVWNFVMENFPIRPEREAHVIAGVSMGGGAAYNLAIKYRERFKTVVGIFPPVNLRWLDCHC